MTELDASLIESISTPKISAGKGSGWYRYYAGFSATFVGDVCNVFRLTGEERVLDPWMGSGTTLSVAARRGCFVDGLDLNPVMAIIAKGRLLAIDTRASIEPLLGELTMHWHAEEIFASDMLRNWFSHETSALIRALARRIDTALVIAQPDPQQKSESMSSLAAFFYVALFETVTDALRMFGSRNPTWIKRGIPNQGTVSLTREEIENKFRESVRRKLQYLDSNGPVSSRVRNMSKAAVGDSRHLPYESCYADAVITSPPYLTRLDYVIGHLPELAVLGLNPLDVRELRKRMIGTPTINRGASSRNGFGKAGEQLLDTIHNHQSYAAISYYEPIFRQYFQGMADSISEIERVCKPNAKVALVVQDSWFKDVHVDLAEAMKNMFTERDWRHVGQKDFLSLRSMAQLNSRAHPDARATKPVESVLFLQTPNRTS